MEGGRDGQDCGSSDHPVQVSEPGTHLPSTMTLQQEELSASHSRRANEVMVRRRQGEPEGIPGWVCGNSELVGGRWEKGPVLQLAAPVPGPSPPGSLTCGRPAPAASAEWRPHESPRSPPPPKKGSYLKSGAVIRVGECGIEGGCRAERVGKQRATSGGVGWLKPLKPASAGNFSFPPLKAYPQPRCVSLSRAL